MELILSIMAADRPGIVERIADVVASHGGNWQESRLATMAGRFAGIIRVSLEQERYGELQTALQALRDEGLNVQIEVGDSDAEAVESHWIEVIGNDRPGIVREVTRALAAEQVNVIDLATDVEPASMSGGLLFRAQLELGLTPGQSMDAVIQALEDLSPDLMVDRLND
ncbi:ACT domain-containing protein [Saccharospirillum sp. HFRX-1]|uniref:glycine cleavage system protein R n=1 Tax=unclassified Saccharospirillum TaxID=2633430 RepID=UPI00371C90FB